jgi:hypothetical protein
VLERIESLLDRLQPLQKLLLELVIHSVGIRSTAGQCGFATIRRLLSIPRLRCLR